MELSIYNKNYMPNVTYSVQKHNISSIHLTLTSLIDKSFFQTLKQNGIIFTFSY